MSNEQVLRAHLAAGQQRETWPRAMDDYDESVVLVVTDRVSPVPGVYFGKRAVGGWFADWLGTFEETTFEVGELVQGADAVAAHARHSARGRGSGVVVATDLYYAYWFRDGKIVRVELHADRESAWRAAGVTG